MRDFNLKAFGKKHIVKLIAAVLVIGVLLNLTSIILRLTKAKDEYILERSSLSLADDIQGKGLTGLCSVDVMSQSEDIKYTVEIEGWAFIETEYDNQQKYVRLVFQDLRNGNLYEVPASLTTRLDVYENLKDLYNIPRTNLAYYTKFSPLELADGEYRLYIYDWENESFNGLIDTGKVYLKSNRSFTEYFGGKEVTYNDFAQAKTSDSVKCNLDNCNEKSEGIYISGWALIENAESADNPVYLEIIKADGTRTVYDTIKMPRTDVGTSFNNSMYDKSGFSAVIPSDAIADGNNMMTIIVGTQEKGNTSYVIASSGGSITSVNLFEKQGGEKVTEVDFSSATASESVKYWFDKCEIVGNMLTVSGWAFLDNVESKDIPVYLEIKSAAGKTSVFDTIKRERTDVGTVMNNSLYNECGFSATISAADALAVGSNTITVIVGTQYKATTSFEFVLDQ